MLETWLAEVRESGRGQMVLLGGEAGVGKTALVRPSPSGIARSQC